MQIISPTQYGPAVQQILAQIPLPPLDAGQPERSAQPLLEKLTPAQLLDDRAVVDTDMAACCLSGLWLVGNFLDESHAISQQVQSPSGSFWHGIMHRREGDFSNAKYWFRRVGEHPIYADLSAAAAKLTPATPANSSRPLQQFALQDRWDPGQFVDLCQQAAGAGSDDQRWCREAAWVEWQLLFDYCYQHAVDPE